MRASEFIVEYKTEEYNGLRFTTDIKNGQLIVRALDDWGTNELGHVVFNIGDQDELDPQDLEVDDRYQGQGIAKTMYDYVKTLGYEIHRSWDQTPAGAGFWNKHRGEDQRVWENMDHSKDDRAVEELRAALVARKEKLQAASDDQVYDIIDKIMTRIARSHSISGQKLHDMWVDKYKEIPDTWIMNENFADGKVRGKSRPGRVARAGASCAGSVSDLRAKARKYGGEKGKMYHWCANMKSGRKK
jgi:GNAT superfamily N-acetyltransferase